MYRSSLVQLPSKDMKMDRTIVVHVVSEVFLRQGYADVVVISTLKKELKLIS